jgi:short-subunit dehydrogenase
LGFNLILVARRESLLEGIKADIEGKFHVNVVVIPFDLSTGASYGQLTAGILERISGLDVSILINNAGVGQNATTFAELTTDAIENLLNLNLISPTLLTHLLMRQLGARAPKSAVINVSSMLGQTPAYGSSVYSSTKAYLRFLTYAVGEETKEKVDFLTVNLGYTSTAMTRYNRGIFTVMPEEVAYGIARDLGRYRETDATFRQHVSGSLLHLFPLSRRISIMSRFLRRNAERNR